METHRLIKEKQQAEAGLATKEEASPTLTEMKRMQKKQLDHYMHENRYDIEGIPESTEKGKGQ